MKSASGDVAILVDSHWRQRFENRSQTDLDRCEKVNLYQEQVTRLGRDIPAELADAEFAGLVRLTPKVAHFLAEQSLLIPKAIGSGNLPQLLEFMRIRGFTISAVDVEGDWAELNQPEDLTHFILGTKAQTVHRLQRLVTKAVSKARSALPWRNGKTVLRLSWGIPSIRSVVKNWWCATAHSLKTVLPQRMPVPTTAC